MSACKSEDNNLKLIGYVTDGKYRELIKLTEEHPNLDLNASQEGGLSLLMRATGAPHTASEHHRVKAGMIDSSKSNIPIVEFLIEKGAHLNEINSQGTTALHYAAYHNRIDIAWILLSEGANPDIQSKTGTTPMMIAASQCYHNITNMIIKFGGNVDLKNKLGETAVDLNKDC